MRINTLNICADALINILAGADALADGHQILQNMGVEEAERLYGAWVKGFAGSRAFDVLLLNTNYHISYIPSKVWDMPWLKTDGTVVTAEELEAIPHWSGRFVRAHEAGIEPYSIAMRHARENGMQVWFSVRMNEFHYLKWPQTSATMWLEHPEYRMAEGRPFDFRHQEVRDYYIRYIAELCRDWDIDGIELDMIRNFDEGAGDEEREAVTDCVRKIRKNVREISAEKGKTIRISARVYGLPEVSRDHWCDAVLWAREGLVDGLTLSNFHTPCNFDFPVEQWKREIGREDVFIQAGSDFGNFGILWNDPRTRTLRHDTESMKGFAEAGWAHGADGVYAFNLNTPDVLDFSGIQSRETACTGWRRHILTMHNPGEDYKLPIALSEEWQARELFVGSGGSPAIVQIGLDAEPNKLEVMVNGKRADALGKLYPTKGEEYVEGVAWNDYAHRIVWKLTEAVPHLYGFRVEGVEEGYARIEVRGADANVMWLEMAVRGNQF